MFIRLDAQVGTLVICSRCYFYCGVVEDWNELPRASVKSVWFFAEIENSARQEHEQPALSGPVLSREVNWMAFRGPCQPE